MAQIEGEIQAVTFPKDVVLDVIQGTPGLLEHQRTSLVTAFTERSHNLPQPEAVLGNFLDQLTSHLDIDIPPGMGTETKMNVVLQAVETTADERDKLKEDLLEDLENELDLEPSQTAGLGERISEVILKVEKISDEHLKAVEAGEVIDVVLRELLNVGFHLLSATEQNRIRLAIGALGYKWSEVFRENL